MNKDWRIELKICMDEFIGVLTAHSHHDESTYRNQMRGNVGLGLPHWRTRSFNRRWNFSRLNSFLREVTRLLWWQAVRRRSQRALKPTVYYRIAAHYLPRPEILHPYPTERFYAKHPKAPR
jgi:hypothetical protein